MPKQKLPNQLKKMPANELPAAWDKNIDRDMSLTEHLQDLRACLLKALAAFAAGTCVSFYFADEIMQLATSAASNLYYMRPAEAFIIYMKLILLSGLVLASPIILYQLYSFIRPALTARERIFMLLCLPVTMCLFLGGMLFSYNFVFPRGLEFFLGFAAGKLNPLISMEC